MPPPAEHLVLVKPSSLFELNLYHRGTHHKMWPHQNSQDDHAIGLHQVLSVEPRPRAPRDPTSTVLDTPAGRATTSASVRAARFIDSGIAACRPLETRHFQVPAAVPHTHFPLDSAPITTGKLAEARLCEQGITACLPVARYGFCRRGPIRNQKHDPPLGSQTELASHRRPGRETCSHMRGRELQFRSSRSSVRPSRFTNQEQHGPVHTSRNLSSQRCLCSPMAPLLGCTFGGIANASDMLRVPCRMRQTANVIVAASHPQITERLHPPFWPRLQLDTTLLRPCVEGAARCRGVPRTHVTHAAVLHRAGYQPQGTAYIDKRLDGRRPHPRIEPAARVTFFSA